MYYQYFGLHEAPFSIAVNPRYLFMSPRHRDALAHLLYGVGAGGGFILLTGEVGTGKTTINRCLLEQLPDHTDIAIILNPALNAAELLASACDELGVDYGDGSNSLKTLTDCLHRFLLDNHARGRNTVLLIDEAQHLDFDVLEQIRLLTNLETNSEKLLQIILIGQPELAQILARPELRQLNQRITARYNLEPLNGEETAAYIRHRLEVAGLAPGRELFPASVVRGIHRKTRGIPRLINLLCDRMLLGAYGQGAARADKSMLAVAAREVMGDLAEPQQRIRPWGMALAGLSLVLVAAALAWWQLSATGKSGTPPMTTQLPASVAPQQADPQPQAPVATIAPAAEAAPASWLLAPDEALALVWSMNTAQPQPVDPCAADSAAALRCSAAVAQTWDDLRALDRPVLLDMVTAERFAASTVLLGIEGRRAWIVTDQGLAQRPLAELASSWRGSYRYFWHPPAGFTRPLALGDNSAVVAEVAALFARLDRQPQPLATSRFNEALQARVILFQGNHGLEADGVVGERTLLKLNELLGIDVTADSARSRLEADGEALVTR